MQTTELPTSTHRFTRANALITGAQRLAALIQRQGRRARPLTLATAALLSAGGSAAALAPNAVASGLHYQLPRVVKRMRFEDLGDVAIEPGSSRIWLNQSPFAGIAGPPVTEGVTVLDPRTYRKLAFFSFAAPPDSNVIFEGGLAFYVLRNGELVEINTRTDRVALKHQLHLGNLTQSIAIDPLTDHLYVTVYEGQIMVFDLKTLRQIGTLPVGSDSVVVDTVDDQVWASNYGLGAVEVFSGRSDRLLHVISIGAHAIPENCSSDCKVIPAGTDGVVVDDKTDMVYADNTNSSQIVVINGRTYKPTRYYQAIEPGDFWPAVNERTDTAYSIEDQLSTLSVLDGRDSALLGAVQIGIPEGPAGCDIFGYENTCTQGGSGPEGIAVNEQTGYVYVGEGGDVPFVFSKLDLPPATPGALVVLAPGRWVKRG